LKEKDVSSLFDSKKENGEEIVGVVVGLRLRGEDSFI
jgi:hypothetical protein